MGWSGNDKNQQFDAALDQVLRSRPPKPKRRSSKLSRAGLVATTIYLSPREVAAVRDLVRKHEVSQTKVFRTLVRMAAKVPIDKPSDKE